ncbi:hypothetical protein BCR44DRAFT_1281493 [Catenaria anguillulae PL171]|uniref:Armadillo-type protein n=1 Tax=Catenaria anguillulae PL171 TaxID=765915 RepID=A0A1Y2HYE9_9FUNG|nr:hypothetical protein BCR44DRAFT_1281493 [Catenaria anguillulae PL171]
MHSESLREVLLTQEGVIKGVVSDVKAGKAELLASALGLLVNFSLDFDKGRSLLVKLDVVPTMLHMVVGKSQHTQYCLHLLSVLVQNERGRDDLVSHRGIDHLIDLLPSTAAIDDENTEIIVEILEHASTDNRTNAKSPCLPYPPHTAC